MSKRVTMQTIAERVGVTKMTVSNAFARPETVSPEVRGRIEQVARELGYAGPDPSARALARGRTGTIGVLLTDQPASAFDDEVAIALVAGVARGLAERSLSLVLLADQPAGDFLPPRDVAMDGAVVYGCSPSATGVGWLVRRGLPLVGVDQYELPGVDLVNVDDHGGARAAGEHLAGLGHRSVAVITPWLDAPHGVVAADPGDRVPPKHAARWTGWHAGLGAASVRVHGEPFELTRDDAAALAEQILRGPHRPSAIACFSDVIALGVLDAASTLGIDVPGELSVVGFDDNPLAAPAGLTTVRQDLHAKGSRAVELLFAASDAVRDGVTRAPEQVVLPCQLVVRATTGPAR